MTFTVKVIVCFFDIDGIDDHYCLNFLFCVQWAKMRGDCFLCWYWWLRWKLIVCFVDIGGIDCHYGWNFLDDHYSLPVRTDVYVM